MKQYIITGKKFEGEIHLFYLEGGFVKVDFLHSDVLDVQKRWILEKVAVREVDLEEMMKRMKNCILVGEDYDVSLEEFKDVYPYARNAHLLPPVWKKMSQSERVMAWSGAIDYGRYCKRNSWYKPKIAAKWLKDREYLNNWRAM